MSPRSYRWWFAAVWWRGAIVSIAADSVARNTPIKEALLPRRGLLLPRSA